MARVATGVALAIGLGFNGSAMANPASSSGQDPKTAGEEIGRPARDEARMLVGAWRLTALDSPGRESEPAGTAADQPAPDGLIIYSPGGYMAAHIVLGAPRTPGGAKSRRNRAGNPAPTHNAYFGTYSVDSAAATITHHRIANNTPGLPVTVTRGYRFVSDDILVLTPFGRGGERLTFRRVGS